MGERNSSLLLFFMMVFLISLKEVLLLFTEISWFLVGQKVRVRFLFVVNLGFFVVLGLSLVIKNWLYLHRSKIFDVANINVV